MKEKDKLRVLIPHWIKHKSEHATEYRDWAVQAGEAAPEILEAADRITKINESLEVALEKLGGPLDYEHRH